MTHPVKKWNFRPHPLLANGHLQSLFGVRWPTNVPPCVAKQHPVSLDDGDRVMLHEDFLPAADSPMVADNVPTVLLIHGLAGSYLSTYMRRTAHRLTQQGYRVFRMDMRGCGAGEGIAKLPPHCGQWADVAAALFHIAELYPEAETSVVAFSMGGSLTLNMLAEAGEMRVGNLQRSLVICPPIDLAHVEQHFRTFWGRRYNNFFIGLIWPQILRRWKLFPDLAPNPIPIRPKRLYDIDELIVAPAGGFASAQDYYQKASPGPKLPSIKQPVTILFSEDDPVVPVEPLFDSLHSSSIETVTTHHGGHLGFLAGRNDDPDFRWLDWRIIEWLAEGQQTKPQAESGKQKDQSHTSELGRSRPHTHATPQPQPR
ncbi:MAG: alpha/beta fold hydrolase [Planctomycetes bacterium]|nr:alpha/beta fold hydrolase [Planctomycetota bacterium]